MRASPAGTYVIKASEVRWQPALDLNRVILGGQVIIVALLVVQEITKRLAS